MDAYDQDMRKFVGELNRAIGKSLPLLSENGFLVKTQSYKRDRDRWAWFAFAFSAEEVRKLQAEPQMMGEMEVCFKCLGGPNENDYSVHPPGLLT